MDQITAKKMKPFRFPAVVADDMICAIQGKRKTVLRQVMKPQPEPFGKAYLYKGAICTESGLSTCVPYRPGDILYIQEPWRIWKAHRYEADAHIEYKTGKGGVANGTTLQFSFGHTNSINRADFDRFIGKWGVGNKWHPSIYMPREAARIFLCVKKVWVERLQSMTEADAIAEGFEAIKCDCPYGWPCTDCMNTGYLEPAMLGFVEMWDSAIKPADRAFYGWEANPWVQVVKFEQCERPE